MHAVGGAHAPQGEGRADAALEAGAVEAGAADAAVQDAAALEADALDAAAFVGETLGPLFLYDPADGRVGTLYGQLRTLDAAAAAREWPLVPEDAAKRALGLMQAGLEVDGAADAEDDTFMPPEGVIWEYRRLFVGPAAKAAPPWGSVYTDRECVIFGESALELRAWLRKTGIAVAGAGEGESEDHIGLMLLLMAWIARTRPQLLGEYLRLHLLPWAPHFLAIVRNAAREPFFEGLADLAAASLSGIEAALALEVDIPRFYR